MFPEQQVQKVKIILSLMLHFEQVMIFNRDWDKYVAIEKCLILLTDF